ncbi:hypothetical protein ES319_D07G013800v1 [Gossypium barbadense]|uniref:F-box associated beta-propeller type 3 domain-containing protein n=1 Tax=Gossypium barbadense TaxID=3634 RepID=A0A5J5QSN9_GOSBA|nr:hypothetical protein ES319_D07G013800v1 [Gossypium barbadense]PPD96997.1 hypothetical protein GOBAR_DD05946 [Gossypium barbadense]
MASYDFSNDVLFEIFSRADLKTMQKCRVLSKECKDLTYESTFMRLHSQRISTMVGYLLQCSKNFGYSWRHRLSSNFVSIANSGLEPKLTPKFLSFLPEPVQIVATVNEGLVLCSTRLHGENRFYICKPSTQQWELIPAPNPRFYRSKISMLVLGSNPLRFKIVGLSDSIDDKHSESDSESDLDSEYPDKEVNHRVVSDENFWHCEIFDSKSWEWKQSEDLKLTYRDFFRKRQGVSACGGLHWLIFNREQDKDIVLSFDGNKEEWTMASLPNSLRRKEYWDQIALVSCEGNLGLVNIDFKTKMVDVWVLNYEHIWIRKHTMNLIKERYLTLFHSFYGADTLVMKDMWSVYFYNFKTQKFDRVTADNQDIDAAYFILTDFESVQLKPE